VAAVFITATGTDVGKTYVAAGLIRHFRAAGRAVDAIKPVVSGFDPQAFDLSDPAALLTALGRSTTIEEIARMSPWRFAAPLSPDMAASREGRALSFDALADFSRRAITAQRDGMLLIEGIGGIMVPLDATHTVLDWMSTLRIPLLLVAGSYLGTISHTLTALQVLARRNLDVAAVVVSESETSPTSLAETVATITRFADSIDVIGVPRGAPDHAAFSRIAQLL
jgi:dethiobiotin synthetase